MALTLSYTDLISVSVGEKLSYVAWSTSFPTNPGYTLAITTWFLLKIRQNHPVLAKTKEPVLKPIPGMHTNSGDWGKMCLPWNLHKEYARYMHHNEGLGGGETYDACSRYDANIYCVSKSYAVDSIRFFNFCRYVSDIVSSTVVRLRSLLRLPITTCIRCWNHREWGQQWVVAEVTDFSPLVMSCIIVTAL